MLSNFLRSLDFFGFPVQLHFGRSRSKDKEGESE